MNTRQYIWMAAGAALALAVAMLALLSPPAAATNDPAAAGGPVYGDWTVTDSRSYDSVTIWLESGNLSVAAGGSLTLTNVQLRFNTTYDPLYDGNYSLTVQANGALSLLSKTNVSSNQSNIHYRFVAKGTLTMDNSSASEMWGDNASWIGGIQVYSGLSSITYSSIYNGKTGGISIFDCSPTIVNNTVHNNGQDGASRTYAYGIYAYNTQTTFKGNLVQNNTYSFYTSYSLSRSKSPGGDPGQGYGSNAYWNGEWYYYTTGLNPPWYRYVYDYLYSKGSMYGTGIRLENSTGAALKNNTILTNGWGPGSSNTYQTPVIEDANHQIYYYYRYYYTQHNLFGLGIYCVNSTVDILGNYLERNGFDMSNTYSGDYICTNKGAAITMVNSGGNIDRNQILHSPTLINNYRSSPNITSNNLFSNFGSYSKLGDGMAFGIRNELSSPYIYNNTVKLTVLDYPFSKSGTVVFNAEYIMGVENLRSPNVVIDRCKITVESTGYCGITLIGINASLKSTGMRVTNSSVDYLFSGYTSSYYAPAPFANAQLAFLSDIYFNNVSMKASGAPTQPVNGILAVYGASTMFLNSSMTGQSYGIHVTDYSKAYLDNSKVTGALATGVFAETVSEVTMVSTTMQNCVRGIQCTGSRAVVRDCTLSNGQEFLLDKISTINVYNTPHQKNAATLIDNSSWINVSWPVTMTVLWQNGAPVVGASVSITTMSGERVFSGVTDQNGSPASVIWIKEYMGHLQTITKYTPHQITVMKGRARSLDMFVIDKALAIEFRLTDNIPPALAVTYPFDMQHLNRSLVEFTGIATDAESGVLDAAIEINIDNTGWVPVPVDETFHTWSYARPMGDGLHVVRVKAADTAGNLARESLSVYVDTTGPVLQVFSPAEGSYTNQRTVTVTGITEEGVFVTVNGISVELQKRFFSLQVSLEVGPNLITVVSSDGAGNARTAQLHVTFDTQPPLLELQSPRNGESTNQDPISVLGSTEPGTVIRVNGVRTPLLESAFEALVGLSEGANTVTVTAVDPAGNQASQTLTVYLDTAAPGVSLFSPRDGLWTNQSKVLVNGATEQGAIVTINGQNTNVVATVFSGYVGLLEGSNEIELVARDLAGNTITLSRTVYLDTRRPDLVVTSPADRSVLGTHVVSVVGSVDFGAEVRVNGEAVSVNDFVFSTTLSFGEDGSQVVEVTARDAAGNTAHLTRAVTLDTKVPSIILSYPVDGMKSKLRLLTVAGQTEPYATVIVNTETMLVAGRDGLFQVPVVLEDGDNRITVTTTDAAGNTETQSVVVIKPAAKAVAKEDLSWVLNLTGMLVGIGLAIPVMTYVLTQSRSRRRAGVLAELEAARAARDEKASEAARLAALPKVERMSRKAKAAKPAEEPRVGKAPEVLPEAPKAEAAGPELAKAGLKDKSGTTEVSPDEIDQKSTMKAKDDGPSGEKGPAVDEPSEAGLKDKGGEAEGEAGETEGSGITKKK